MKLEVFSDMLSSAVKKHRTAVNSKHKFKLKGQQDTVNRNAIAIAERLCDGSNVESYKPIFAQSRDTLNDTLKQISDEIEEKVIEEINTFGGRMKFVIDGITELS